MALTPGAVAEEVDAISCKNSHEFVRNACMQFGKADAMCVRAEQGHRERCGSLPRASSPASSDAELLRLSKSDGVAKTATPIKKLTEATTAVRLKESLGTRGSGTGCC